MSGLTTFDIKLYHPTATFTPGSEITGRVILVLSETLKFRALKIRFKGRCKVRWKVQQSTYQGRENYFHTDIPLLESTGGHSMEMYEGSYVYPFTFQLPHNIPSSYEHHVGSVRYSIKAIIDRPWKFDHETKILFPVETSFDQSLINSSLRPVDDEAKTKYYCLFPCISQGSISVQIYIPRAGYTVGDIIEARINVNNKSDVVDITEVEFTLEQILTFYSRLPRKMKRLSYILEKAKEEGPIAKSTELRLALQVPIVPASHLENCNLIEIDYQMFVQIHVSGLHFSTTKRYNVLIGPRPSSTLVQIASSFSGLTFPTPSAPFSPIDY